jgi:hypothetical protein
VPLAENPLVRDFNYAPRDRNFSSLAGSWTATPTLTWTVEGALTKDDYRSSPLGLQSAHEQRWSSTLTWTPRDTLSAYVDAGYQRVFMQQNGYTGANTAPWLGTNVERFWNADLGGRWVPQQRWTLTLDYLLAPSYEVTENQVGGLIQPFPQSWTKLTSTRFKVAYQWTPSLRVNFLYAREQYNSSDWALNGVGPSTIANLLALGVQPYRNNVNVFGLSVRYQFGRDATAHSTP